MLTAHKMKQPLLERLGIPYFVVKDGCNLHLFVTQESLETFFRAKAWNGAPRGDIDSLRNQASTLKLVPCWTGLRGIRQIIAEHQVQARDWSFQFALCHNCSQKVPHVYLRSTDINTEGYGPIFETPVFSLLGAIVLLDSFIKRLERQPEEAIHLLQQAAALISHNETEDD